MSLSRLAVCLGVAAGSSVGRARFELFLPPLMAIFGVVSGAEVLVSAWATRAALELAGRAGQLAPLVVTGVKNSTHLGERRPGGRPDIGLERPWWNP